MWKIVKKKGITAKNIQQYNTYFNVIAILSKSDSDSALLDLFLRIDLFPFYRRKRNFISEKIRCDIDIRTTTT